MRIPSSEEFNAPGHWFTSYPSLNHWSESFRHSDYVEALTQFTDPLHLYLHIPFCKKLCSYCICNVVISSDREKIQFFLDHLLKEIDLLKPFEPDIQDIHFGGGTPSHLDRKQFAQLCSKLDELTDIRSLKEVAMEIDPRTVNQDDLKHYASFGVNRISFGIQDYDLRVQEAINRVQPPELIDELLEVRHLFRGVNFDLLYGLPLQTRQTLRNTVSRVLKQRPDRITLLKYCHAPEIRKHMKLINVTDLPSPENLPMMFCETAESLMEAGYLWIGLDHFCLPSDSLSKKVGRTFNGFTSGTNEMIGLGPTTTGVFGRTYCQSTYDLHDYYNSINKGEFPIHRGYRMTDDDMKRRRVIFSLLCNHKVIVDPFYFEKELNQLWSRPELCEVWGNEITVTDYGRILLRNICKVFDNKDVLPEHDKIAQKTITRKIKLEDHRVFG